MLVYVPYLTNSKLDFVLVDLGSRLLPVKSGSTVASDAFDGLRFWLGLPGNLNASGVLVYGGIESYVRSGVTVLPWFLS